MKVIAIIGASGYIGKHLVAELVRSSEYEIRILTRKKSLAPLEKEIDSKVQIIEGDINDKVSLKYLLKSGCTVINLVYLWDKGSAANLEAIKNLLDVCILVGIGRLIHCSTAAVVGRTQDNLISEHTICKPITEYGITKLKIEQIVTEMSRKNFDAVILRPTSVFGVEGEPLKKLANDLANGSNWRNHLKSYLFGHRRMNLVHISNVVAAMLFLTQSKNQFQGEIFIISDDDHPDNNFASVEKLLMQTLKMQRYNFPKLELPLGVLSFILNILGRNNINPRCNYNPHKLLSLGFNRPVDFNDGLKDYADWYLSKYHSSNRYNR